MGLPSLAGMVISLAIAPILPKFRRDCTQDFRKALCSTDVGWPRLVDRRDPAWVGGGAIGRVDGEELREKKPRQEPGI
jgi:hypothetical protein